MISCHPLSIISTTCSIVANNIIAHNLHRHKATSCNFNSGGGGGGGGGRGNSGKFWYWSASQYFETNPNHIPGL